ncbi:MAG: type II toxin-antitoxin system HicB family antitoxin [Solidesulfovibrio sp.]
MKTPTYPFEISLLGEEDGPGYLITFPDLPGCMSDGATVEEAIQNGVDAEQSWLNAARKWGDAIPEPGKGTNKTGEFRTRVPKSLHAKLARQAEIEGVSMNTLTVALLAEGLGRKDAGRR